MKKQHLFVGSLLIAVVVIGAYGVWHTIQPAPSTASSVMEETFTADNGKAHQPPRAADEAGETAEGEVPPPMIQYVGSVKPDTSVHGEVADIYRTYDDDTLEELAAGGDLMAIKVMALRMAGFPADHETEGLDVEEEQKFWDERMQKRKEYLELAIAYGDTELAGYSSSLYGDERPLSRSTQEKIRHSLLEKLAFWEFVAMRGKQSQKYVRVPSVIDSYNHYLGEPLTLTAEDKAYIRDRAQTIYDDYEEKREELGLGPFEDTQEEIVSHYPGHSPTQEYIDEMGDNAF